MFCVECGKEGNVFEALCPSCFLKRKKLIELPKSIDIPSCSTCNAMFIGRKWKLQELEASIDELIASAIWQNPVINILELRSEPRFEDSSNVSVKIIAKVSLDNLESALHKSVRVRLKPGTCPTCSKLSAKYYEAILQIRAGSKASSEDAITEIKGYVRSRVNELSDEVEKSFIAKEEDIRGGVDFYISSNRAARAIAKELAKKFNGTVKSSSKLYGRVNGKEVYRVTYIVRLP